MSYGSSIGRMVGRRLPFPPGGSALQSPVPHSFRRRHNDFSRRAEGARSRSCMFDQYGTVVDMQKGLTEFATPFLKAKGWTGNPGSFVTWWRRTHFENSMIDALLHREHTPYREIGHRAVAYIWSAPAFRYTQDDVRYLVAQIEKLKRFRTCRRRSPGCSALPDRRPVQRRPRHAGGREGAPPDSVRRGDLRRRGRTRSSRTSPPTPRPPRSWRAMDEVLFVANHAFDCLGAKAAGMHTASSTGASVRSARRRINPICGSTT